MIGKRANLYFYRTFLDNLAQQLIVRNGLCITLSQIAAMTGFVDWVEATGRVAVVVATTAP